MYFPETDHWINNDFGFEDFFNQHGGLAIFGYPITGAQEIEGGQVVQYFQRQRMERLVTSHKPTPGSAVTLGLLGVEHLQLQKDLKHCMEAKPFYDTTKPKQ